MTADEKEKWLWLGCGLALGAGGAAAYALAVAHGRENEGRVELQEARSTAHTALTTYQRSPDQGFQALSDAARALGRAEAKLSAKPGPLVVAEHDGAAADVAKARAELRRSFSPSAAVGSPVHPATPVGIVPPPAGIRADTPLKGESAATKNGIWAGPVPRIEYLR